MTETQLHKSIITCMWRNFQILHASLQNTFGENLAAGGLNLKPSETKAISLTTYPPPPPCDVTGACVLTCVRRAGVEQRVGVGDKLQLAVQVGQQAAGQTHVHLTVTFDSHPVHLRCHVQRPQSSSDVYL